MATFAIDSKSMKSKALTAALAIVLSVALPQLFHAAGMLSGLGASLGAALLPMHLPVLIAGLIAGPFAGLIAGAVSPAVSFAISGMPAANMVLFMAVELAGYGLAAGLLHKVKMPVFFKLVMAQLAGRLLKTAAVGFALGVASPALAQTWNAVLTGLPGILLQWAIIPLLLYRLNGLKKYDA